MIFASTGSSASSVSCGEALTRSPGSIETRLIDLGYAPPVAHRIAKNEKRVGIYLTGSESTPFPDPPAPFESYKYGVKIRDRARGWLRAWQPHHYSFKDTYQPVTLYRGLSLEKLMGGKVSLRARDLLDEQDRFSQVGNAWWVSRHFQESAFYATHWTSRKLSDFEDDAQVPMDVVLEFQMASNLYYEVRGGRSSYDSEGVLIPGEVDDLSNFVKAIYLIRPRLEQDQDEVKQGTTQVRVTRPSPHHPNYVLVARIPIEEISKLRSSELSDYLRHLLKRNEKRRLGAALSFTIDKMATALGPFTQEDRENAGGGHVRHSAP